MRVIFDELITTLSQEFTVSEDRHVYLTNIRPGLIIVGNPVGSIFMELQDENGRVVAKSFQQSIAEIKSQAGFASKAVVHGYASFELTVGLMKGTTYRLAMKSTGGYGFSGTDYVGWKRNWEMQRAAAAWSPNAGFESEFDYEFWEKNPLIRRSTA